MSGVTRDCQVGTNPNRPIGPEDPQMPVPESAADYAAAGRRRLAWYSLACFFFAILSGVVYWFFVSSALFQILTYLLALGGASLGVASLRPGSQPDRLRARIAGEHIRKGTAKGPG